MPKVEPQLKQIIDMMNDGANLTTVSRKLNIPFGKARYHWEKYQRENANGIATDTGWRESVTDNQWSIHADGETLNTMRIRNVEDMVKKLGIDLTVWRVAKVSGTGWDTSMKLRSFDDGKVSQERPFKTQNQRIHVIFERIVPVNYELLADSFLERIAKVSPKVPRGDYPVFKVAKNRRRRRSLEISMMDPHMGMRCFKPGSDMFWSPDKCKSMMLEMCARMLKEAEKFGPFEEIVWPFGNDFLHADNLFHTTTAGTPQPEMEAYHNSYELAEAVACDLVDLMREVAPVRIIQVPGNHDRQSSFTLGRVLKAYYRNDKNVTVEAGCGPFKFYNFGVNLIGFEHGHSIAPVRMAALMANETRTTHWANARFCEWHCGDQHRKGSAKPSAFEEQGVSVEYLPALTPPNEWHRLKSYNWQKRAGLFYIYDFTAGLKARGQINVDSYTGEIMN